MNAPYDSTKQNSADIVIVGAGIVGLSLARELKIRYPDQRIVIFEKEPELGAHASGRNSGVLHSGIYYPPDSLKAKVCAEGAKLLGDYCEQENLPLRRCGKVILPTRPEEDPQLELLLSRGQANGVTCELIDNQQLKAIEPEAHSCTNRALWVPITAVFDPKVILKHLAKQLTQQGVQLVYNSQVTNIKAAQRQININGKTVWHYDYLINTAGLYADHIAQAFGLSERYTILPFKGLYYQLKANSALKINGLIYPVPDLDMPFLGVHFTRSIADTVYLGPGALPALGRENYHGLDGLDPAELPQIVGNLADCYINNRQAFRKFAHLEISRLWRPNFVEACQAMVPGIEAKDIETSSKVGIRAQLLDIKARALAMDFVVEQEEHSLHVLNAVSPAFTSAFSFARYVLDSYLDPSGLKATGSKSLASQIPPEKPLTLKH